MPGLLGGSDIVAAPPASSVALRSSNMETLQDRQYLGVQGASIR
jgi:hypothetical protein